MIALFWRPPAAPGAEDTVDEATVRRELIILAGQKRCRVIGREAGIMACRWNPESVCTPTAGLPFTGPEAWRFFVQLMVAGHPIRAVPFRASPGLTAYELFVDLRPGERQLYIKVALGRGKVIGLSFHYSEYTTTPAK